MIRPFSKAGPRQNTKRNNRKMSSAIVTDSPERKKIEEKEYSAKVTVKKMTTKDSIKTRKTKSEINKENSVLQDDSDSSDSI
ncbi:unnamed protein product [Acanthoscelides obtectus]|uniref:Uncharacterized protein n=1 Tax=Acanthoscelides obtectus TaxID=200917 RepID=A0A9P0KDN1_ACAOB|nr:unnamed protein product [Acanthoscelides obtectus]CAK1680329.1 hypothetical protein AOBTE_LOCUS32581 [Acanthoscelides obtectus]